MRQWRSFRSTKLLGTIITDDLKWNLNTMNIVKKANARMELVRKMASFGTSVDDLKNIYFHFIRSLLEQSATVWHSGLSDENSNEIERMNIILFKKKTSASLLLMKVKFPNFTPPRFGLH